MSFVADLTALVAASVDHRHCCPDGWSRVPLGSVAKIINGFPFKSGGFGDRGYPVIRIRDVTRGHTTTRFDGDAPNGFWVNAGDLLVGMDGDFQTAFWRSDRALLNQRVCKIVPDDSQIDRRYLAYILPGYLALINANTPSVTVKHLSSRTLASIPLPLPPLERQQRIVARLDELFAEIGDGEAALARARGDLATWRKALLKAAVTGELTADWRADNPPTETGSDLLARILAGRRARWDARLKGKGKGYVAAPSAPVGLRELPDGWCWATLGELTTVVTSGSRAWSPYYDRGQCTFIMAQNVRPGRFDPTFRQLVDPPEGDAERARTAVKRDDLLLTIVGANTGDLCQFNIEPDEHYVCQSVALLRLAEPSMAPIIEAFFNNDFGRRLQMEKMIYGAGRPHLSFDQIKEMAVPVPPEAERREIAIIVRRVMMEADAGSDDITALSFAPLTLRQSILAAAFRGDLA